MAICVALDLDRHKCIDSPKAAAAAANFSLYSSFTRVVYVSGGKKKKI